MKIYSSAIDTAQVTHVLMRDGWHRVGRILPDIPDSALSFSLQSLVFNDDENGYSKPVAGFWFLDDHSGLEIHGPLTELCSVRVQGLHKAPRSWFARARLEAAYWWRRITGAPLSKQLTS